MSSQKTKLNFLIPISLIMIFGSMVIRDFMEGNWQTLSILGLVWGIMELGFYILVIKTDGEDYYLDERVRYSFIHGESWGFITFSLMILGVLFYNTMSHVQIELAKPSNLVFILIVGFLVRTVSTLLYRYKNVSVKEDLDEDVVIKK